MSVSYYIRAKSAEFNLTNKAHEMGQTRTSLRRTEIHKSRTVAPKHPIKRHRTNRILILNKES